jgi:hypothetical protein
MRIERALLSSKLFAKEVPLYKYFISVSDCIISHKVELKSNSLNLFLLSAGADSIGGIENFAKNKEEIISLRNSIKWNRNGDSCKTYD